MLTAILLLCFSEGQSVSLLDIIPEAGEVLILEGPTGCGKTTVAQILLSSWTEGPRLAPSNFPDLSDLGHLICVDCSMAKSDLFQETATQLSLSEKISTQELRTVLTSSGRSLLLLDGYREGNSVFDESLNRFLSERGHCSLLITACSGHCPTLTETLGTDRVLKLQMPSARYWGYSKLMRHLLYCWSVCLSFVWLIWQSPNVL